MITLLSEEVDLGLVATLRADASRGVMVMSRQGVLVTARYPFLVGNFILL